MNLEEKKLTQPFGIFTTGFCTSCNKIKDKLNNSNIKYFEHKFGNFDKEVMDKFNLNSVKYGYSNSLPQIIHEYDYKGFPVNMSQNDINEYNKIFDLCKEYINCKSVLNSQWEVCLDGLISSYNNL
jgi:hypothetical protein